MLFMRTQSFKLKFFTWCWKFETSLLHVCVDNVCNFRQTIWEKETLFNFEDEVLLQFLLSSHPSQFYFLPWFGLKIVFHWFDSILLCTLSGNHKKFLQFTKFSNFHKQELLRKFEGNYHVDEHKISFYRYEEGRDKISQAWMLRQQNLFPFDVNCGLRMPLENKPTQRVLLIELFHLTSKAIYIQWASWYLHFILSMKIGLRNSQAREDAAIRSPTVTQDDGLLIIDQSAPEAHH